MSDPLAEAVRLNRAATKYAPRTQVARFLWAAAAPLFRLMPRPLHAPRNALLRLFGARIGRAVRIDPSVRIAMPWNLAIGDGVGIGADVRLYALGRISIGAGATVSQGAHLCAGTHDHRRLDLPLLKPPIAISEGAWVCADAFVGPGVTIGARTVLGARAVAVRSLPGDVVAVGNPARTVGPRRLDPAAPLPPASPASP